MNTRLLHLFVGLCLVFQLHALTTFRNPIIPGFHPDPSICRVGEDYYLVTSSFEWYPGLPIYHSKDLMHWEQIGHVLTRPSQLNLKAGLKHSAGLWAPTIRYHEGVFYVICTAQQAGGNFYVTAKSPAGPWSEPVFLKDAPGIDPSLFFDDDGTCWYTGSINGTKNQDRYPNEDRIYIQKLDLQQGKLVGERKVISTGHAVNAPFAEAPHLYKIGKKYLLLVAEGGTWNNHAVTAFMADSVMGPYVPGIANPVLTHRFLGKQADITTVGHADLVQTPEGKWWSVMLGVRSLDGFTMLGRETFLTPVEFQNGWPVFNPGVGRVLSVEKATGIRPHPFPLEPVRDDFDTPELRNCWNFLRTPYTRWFELADGKLTLQLRPESVKEPVNPSLIARRIQHFNFTASTTMHFKPEREGEEAGLILMQNGANHYRLVKQRRQGKDSLLLYKVDKGRQMVMAAVPYKDKQVCLWVVAQGKSYRFYVGSQPEKMTSLGEAQDATINSSNHAGGFIGPFIGMYASSNGQKSGNKVSFDYFEYKEGAAFPLQVRKHSLHEIAVRDPYIFPDEKTQTYYLYCATRQKADRPNGKHGLKMYKSRDLKTWEGPYMVYESVDSEWADASHGIWAPEMHEYKGKYYLFATFTNEKSSLPQQVPSRPFLHRRATVLLVSDTPEGPFVPLTGKPHTPADWMSLDGTLYVENRKPYMVFCHEWTQMTDGTMELLPLSEDLYMPEGTPVTMFRAKDASWVQSLDMYKGKKVEGYVTDGCFLHRNANGKLIMLWSSFGPGGYAVSTAVSVSGSIWGPWKHRPSPLYGEHGGHAMLFKTFDGRLVMTLHYPNGGAEPHARFFEMKEADDTLEIVRELVF